jgi:hypothetical protein
LGDQNQKGMGILPFPKAAECTNAEQLPLEDRQGYEVLGKIDETLEVIEIPSKVRDIADPASIVKGVSALNDLLEGPGKARDVAESAHALSRSGGGAGAAAMITAGVAGVLAFAVGSKIVSGGIALAEAVEQIAMTAYATRYAVKSVKLTIVMKGYADQQARLGGSRVRGAAVGGFDAIRSEFPIVDASTIRAQRIMRTVKISRSVP